MVTKYRRMHLNHAPFENLLAFVVIVILLMVIFW